MRRCRVFLKIHGDRKGFLKPLINEKFSHMRAGGTVLKVHYASLSQKLVVSRWGWERGRDSISSEVQGSAKGGGRKPEKEKQNILLGALSSNSIWARQEMSAPSGVDRGSNRGHCCVALGQFLDPRAWLSCASVAGSGWEPASPSPARISKQEGKDRGQGH